MIRTKKKNPIRDNAGKILGGLGILLFVPAAFLINRTVGSQPVRTILSIVIGIAGFTIIAGLFTVAIRAAGSNSRRRSSRALSFAGRVGLCLLFLVAIFVYIGSIVLWTQNGAAELNTLPTLVAGAKAAIFAFPDTLSRLKAWLTGSEIKPQYLLIGIVVLAIIVSVIFRGHAGGSTSSSGSGSSSGSYHGSYSSAYEDLDYLNAIRKVTQHQKIYGPDSYPDPEAPGPDPEGPGPDPEAPVDIHDLY